LQHLGAMLETKFNLRAPATLATELQASTEDGYALWGAALTDQQIWTLALCLETRGQTSACCARRMAKRQELVSQGAQFRVIAWR